MSKNSTQGTENSPGEQAAQNHFVLTITLASDPRLPKKVIRAPGDAPISTILSYAAEKFGVEAATSALLTESGVGIGLAQTVSSVVWSYGTELSLIPRDRVGANS